MKLDDKLPNWVNTLSLVLLFIITMMLVVIIYKI
jgi:hypothetical protein